ncbi:MAG: helix-turn-helix domain-containing protein [Xanthobacteraceae bacterium]
MARKKSPDRSNQRYRTRSDLLTAAANLSKEGRKPTLEQVAEAARVSRATAYRYFPSIDALLVEASFNITVPDGEKIFAGDPAVDPEERAAKAEAAMHRATFDNEYAIRLMLASSITRGMEEQNSDAPPFRQNRRTPLIDAALAPARGRFDDAIYARLRAALALMFGPEAMIVFRDVLRVDERIASEVKAWAVRALVHAALEQSQPNRQPIDRTTRTAARARATEMPRTRSRAGA